MPCYAASWEYPKIKIDFIIRNLIRKIYLDLLLKNSIFMFTNLHSEIDEMGSITHMCISNETIKRLDESISVSDKVSLNVETHSMYQMLSKRYNSTYHIDKIASIPKNDGNSEVIRIDLVALHLVFFSDLMSTSIKSYNNYIDK